MKMLPSGVYHYRFIVDECLRYAPDVPWECDDSGNAYNVLDLQVILKNPLSLLEPFWLEGSPVFAYDKPPTSAEPNKLKQYQKRNIRSISIVLISLFVINIPKSSGILEHLGLDRISYITLTQKIRHS